MQTIHAPAAAGQNLAAIEAIAETLATRLRAGSLHDLRGLAAAHGGRPVGRPGELGYDQRGFDVPPDQGGREKSQDGIARAIAHRVLHWPVIAGANGAKSRMVVTGRMVAEAHLEADGFAEALLLPSAKLAEAAQLMSLEEAERHFGISKTRIAARAAAKGITFKP